ncbi:mitochondrial CIII assembly factor LYRM7 [Andalucia godoyi]|uniref:Mitochondrial CIII assembly factor LYRM7 n=1 Tax=Andalucia godoyi TaxID=505711 RepID=A0A8K0AJ05_ANDGO|nr:mitochondrial CIII assembly factor LYRM7 [Andalucia godoyi]|eukprot:ANDGO_04481.mRNA.1 mitochondrial CIII assembly factor LYRM7
MSGVGLRSSVLGSFRRLLRAAEATFSHDSQMLVSSRSEIRSHYDSNRQLSNSGMIRQALEMAEEAARFVRQAVVQTDGARLRMSAEQVQLANGYVEIEQVNADLLRAVDDEVRGVAVEKKVCDGSSCKSCSCGKVARTACSS